MKDASENKEESRTEGGAAGGADEPGFYNRVAKESLHQRAANAKTGTNQQTEKSARQTQFQENTLVQSGFRGSGKKRSQCAANIRNRKINSPITNREG